MYSVAHILTLTNSLSHTHTMYKTIILMIAIIIRTRRNRIIKDLCREITFEKQLEERSSRYRKLPKWIL